MSRARTTVAELAVLTALLLAAAIGAAEAGAREVCCFRVTIDVNGSVDSDYGSSDPRHGDYLEGLYFYGWSGTAYGLARWNGFTLSSERGVASGSLGEGGSYKQVDYNGQENYAAENKLCKPRPSVNFSAESGGNSFDIPLTKAGAGFPKIGVHGGRVGLSFGNPYIGWELNCGFFATEALHALEEVNHVWSSPRRFFDYFFLSGISATRLGQGGSQQLLCFEHARKVTRETTVTGSYAIYINIVHFPASKEKANLRRLHDKLGTPTPQNNPAEKAQLNFANQSRGAKAPDDGCHPYTG
jgi:hypothetical protein